MVISDDHEEQVSAVSFMAIAIQLYSSSTCIVQQAYRISDCLDELARLLKHAVCWYTRSTAACAPGAVLLNFNGFAFGTHKTVLAHKKSIVSRFNLNMHLSNDQKRFAIKLAIGSISVILLITVACATLLRLQSFASSGTPPSLDVNVDCSPCAQTKPSYCETLPYQYKKVIWFITDGM